VTSFGEGKGNNYWVEGRCVSSRPWHNITALEPQAVLLLPEDQPAIAGR